MAGAGCSFSSVHETMAGNAEANARHHMQSLIATLLPNVNTA